MNINTSLEPHICSDRKHCRSWPTSFCLASDRASIRYLCLRVDQECHHDRILECLYSHARLFDQQCTLFRFEACPVDINSAAIGMDEGVPALALREIDFGAARKVSIV